MKIYGYARVSSQEQAFDSKALEQQKARLQAAGAELILEDVESGAKDDRPAFQQLQTLIQEGQVSEVVITRLDRITRSLSTLLRLINLLTEFEVRLRVLDDNIDTSTAAGRFHVNIMGSVAEMELDQLRERVRHGKQYAKDQKRHLSAPFGYALESGALSPNLRAYRDGSATYFDVARQIIDRFLESGSLSGVIREFSQRYGGARLPGHWSNDFTRDASGLKRWLLNPVLRGSLIYNARRADQIEFPNAHPYPLLTDEEFFKVKDLLKANGRTKTIHGRMVNPLVGLIFCGGCGSPMFTSTGRRVHFYILCTGAYPRAKSPRVCDRRASYGLKLEGLESAVIQALVQRADELLVDEIQVEQTTDSPEIQKLLTDIKNLESLGDPDLEPVIQLKRGRVAALRRELSAEAVDLQARRSELVIGFSDIAVWEVLSFEERRQLYLRFVESVTCNKGAISVELKV